MTIIADQVSDVRLKRNKDGYVVGEVDMIVHNFDDDTEDKIVKQFKLNYKMHEIGLDSAEVLVDDAIEAYKLQVSEE